MDRFNIATGNIPEKAPDPFEDTKLSAMVSTKFRDMEKDVEIKFLIEAHEKFMINAEGNKSQKEMEFCTRINKLFLEDQISEKAYNIISEIYGYRTMNKNVSRSTYPTHRSLC